MVGIYAPDFVVLIGDQSDRRYFFGNNTAHFFATGLGKQAANGSIIPKRLIDVVETRKWLTSIDERYFCGCRGSVLHGGRPLRTKIPALFKSQRTLSRSFSRSDNLRQKYRHVFACADSDFYLRG